MRKRGKGEKSTGEKGADLPSQNWRKSAGICETARRQKRGAREAIFKREERHAVQRKPIKKEGVHKGGHYERTQKKKVAQSERVYGKRGAPARPGGRVPLKEGRVATMPKAEGSSPHITHWRR